jgi:flagellar FliL protein
MLPLMLVMNTAVLAGVLIFVMRKPAPAAAASAHEGEAVAKESEGPGEGEANMPGPTVQLQNFIIQLKTLEAEARYVRVAFDLEVGNEADKNSVNVRMAAIRDSVIAYFADRTLDELRGSEAMAETKATLLKRLDGIVPGHRIKAIYITDFVVQ